MKKNELLYRAIGDINENTAADAYECRRDGGGGRRVRFALRIAAAVVAVLGLFAFYLVLMKYSSRDNIAASPTTDSTASDTAGEEPSTGGETSDTAEKETAPNIIDTPVTVEQLSLEALYGIYPYSELMPVDIPQGFEFLNATRAVFGEAPSYESSALKFKETASLVLIKNADGAKIDSIEYRDVITITVREKTEDEKNGNITPYKLSEQSIENSAKTDEDTFGDRSVKLRMTYKGVYCTDEYAVEYYYQKLLKNNGDRSKPVKAQHADYAALLGEPVLSAGDIYDMLTSAPYFKTHSVSELDGKEPEKRVFTCGTDKDLKLTVEFGSDGYVWNSLVNITASLKNNTDKTIYIYRPVEPYDRESHTEISVEIYRPDNTAVRLKDIDTYDVPFDCAESWRALAPGEEYVQKMRFTGDKQSFGEQGSIEMSGEYNVDVRVIYKEDMDTPETVMFISGQMIFGGESDISAQTEIPDTMAEPETYEATDEATDAAPESDTEEFIPVYYDQALIDEYLDKIYSHPGTSNMAFSLKDRPTEIELEGCRIEYGFGCEEVFDPAFEGDGFDGKPYQSYHIAGYPDCIDAYAVIGVNIYNDTTKICGIGVNSSFDEFEATFSSLGFTVTRETVGVRSFISARIDGMIIELYERYGTEAPANMYMTILSTNNNNVVF